MPLTDLEVRRAAPRAKTYRISDGRGMYLGIAPTGGKYWHLKYRFLDREKRLALGVYPDVMLAASATRHVRCWQTVLTQDRLGKRKSAWPGSTRRRPSRRLRWSGLRDRLRVGRPAIRRRSWGHLKKDLFPWLGSRPIADITPPEVFEVLRRAESRGAHDTAHRLHQNCGQVFRYAVATGRTARDVSADLRGALRPNRHTHFASITDPAKVGKMLLAFDGFSGTLVVRAALRLAPLLFVRPGELRRAE
jgi:hypothetical protein